MQVGLFSDQLMVSFFLAEIYAKMLKPMDSSRWNPRL